MTARKDGFCFFVFVRGKKVLKNIAHNVPSIGEVLLTDLKTKI